MLAGIQADMKRGFESAKTETDAIKSEMNNHFNRLELKVGNLETKVGNLETKVGNLETKVGNLETKVTRLDTRVANLETSVAGLKTSMVSLNSRVGSLETSVASIETNVIRINTNVANIDTKIDALDQGLGSLALRLKAKYASSVMRLCAPNPPSTNPVALLLSDWNTKARMGNMGKTDKLENVFRLVNSANATRIPGFPATTFALMKLPCKPIPPPCFSARPLTRANGFLQPMRSTVSSWPSRNQPKAPLSSAGSASRTSASCSTCLTGKKPAPPTRSCPSMLLTWTRRWRSSRWSTGNSWMVLGRLLSGGHEVIIKRSLSGIRGFIWQSLGSQSQRLAN